MPISKPAHPRPLPDGDVDRGADFAGPDLREKLSVDCPKHDSAEFERCDLYFPDMLNVS